MRTRGSTLVEILIAVVFMAVAAGALLDAVWTSNAVSTYSIRRSRILATLRDALETARGTASAGTLIVGVTTVNLSLVGIPEPVSVTTTIAFRATSMTLYDVTAEAVWYDETTGRVRTDTLSLATVVLQ